MAQTPNPLPQGAPPVRPALPAAPVLRHGSPPAQRELPLQRR